MKKYNVLLTRTVLSSTWVTVLAESEDDAVDRAETIYMNDDGFLKWEDDGEEGVNYEVEEAK